jgi:hypothetical protein
MQIGIPLSKDAYTPEAFAYSFFLEKLGHEVQLDYELDPNNDINFYFMGVIPFWHKKEGRAIDIHEYQSLSTPPYANIKDGLKRVLNKKPSGRIFLNKTVHHELGFNDNVPHIYRDMGVEKELFQTPSKNPTYDIVYCGSITNRPGLVQAILKLSVNFKIVIVGNITELEREVLNKGSIDLLGRVDRSYLPNIYREARYGLNFTPDIYPYNIQTSTKTLEYMASGLDIISNKYFWAERFFSMMNYQPFWLEEDILPLMHNSLKSIIPIQQALIKEYSWENILTSSNLESFLRDCLHNEIY